MSDEAFDEALNYLLAGFKEEIVFESGSFFAGIRWDKVGKTLNGIEVWRNTEKNGVVKGRFLISGFSSSQLNIAESWDCLLGFHRNYDLTVTSMMINVRDYNCRKRPFELLDYFGSGLVTGLKRYEYKSEMKRGGILFDYCLLFIDGRDKYIRVNDAKPICDVDAVDWELNLRKKYANKAFNELMNLDIVGFKLKRKEEYLFRYIGSMVLGCLTFVSDSSKPELLQDWWRDFINEVS